MIFLTRFHNIVQTHTVNHPILTSVPDEVLDLELRDSQHQLQNMLPYGVTAFSYPNGSLSSREVNAVKKYYDIAFTTEQNNITETSVRYLLPRYALTGDYFRDLLKIHGVWKRLKRISRF